MSKYQCLGCFEIFQGDFPSAVVHGVGLCPKCRADLELGRREGERCRHRSTIAHDWCLELMIICAKCCPCAAWEKGGREE